MMMSIFLWRLVKILWEPSSIRDLGNKRHKMELIFEAFLAFRVYFGIGGFCCC